MSDSDSALHRTRNRRKTSCKSCNERKVKCDLGRPCRECQRKGFECVYVLRPISSLNRSSLKLTMHRMTVEMDVYRQMEVFWRNMTVSALFGDLTNLTKPGIEHAADFRPFPFPCSSVDLDDPATISSLAAINMFIRRIEMVLPHYRTSFDYTVAGKYWRLFSRPIHVDLNSDFDDPEYKPEKRAAGIFIKKKYHPFPTHATEDAVKEPAFRSLDVQCESSDDPGDAPPNMILPSYERQNLTSHIGVEGYFVSNTGRIFDAMSDFLRVKLTSASDLINLLEYGCAFVLGLRILEQMDLQKHFALNCRRILNDLIILRREELSRNLAIRIINCINAMAFYYAATGENHTLVSVLLFAHSLAIDHKLHESEPVLTARIYLILIWHTSTQAEREAYTRLSRPFFSSRGDLDARCKFAYVASALKSQAMDEPCTHTKETTAEFWCRVESWLDDCDAMFANMHKFGMRPEPLIYFKCLSAFLRAELGPRIGKPEEPLRQAEIVELLLSGLSDAHTLAAVLHLRIHCHTMRAKSAPMKYRGMPTTVSDFMLSVLDHIVLPPLFPHQVATEHAMAYTPASESPLSSSPSSFTRMTDEGSPLDEASVYPLTPPLFDPAFRYISELQSTYQDSSPSMSVTSSDPCTPESDSSATFQTGSNASAMRSACT